MRTVHMRTCVCVVRPLPVPLGGGQMALRKPAAHLLGQLRPLMAEPTEKQAMSAADLPMWTPLKGEPTREQIDAGRQAVLRRGVEPDLRIGAPAHTTVEGRRK